MTESSFHGVSACREASSSLFSFPVSDPDKRMGCLFCQFSSEPSKEQVVLSVNSHLNHQKNRLFVLSIPI